MNPLFNALGGALPTGDGGFGGMLAQLNEFRRTFQGNPQQEVQRLLSTGQMTQQQYNQLAGMASQIMQFMR